MLDGKDDMSIIYLTDGNRITPVYLPRKTANAFRKYMEDNPELTFEDFVREAIRFRNEEILLTEPLATGPAYKSKPTEPSPES